jgi:Type VI secretion system, TssN
MNRLYSPGATWHLRQDRKWLTGYLLLFAVPILGLGPIAFLKNRAGMSIIPELLQWIGFQFLGIAHLFFFQRRLVTLNKKILLFSRTGWYFTVILSIQVVVLLTLLYLLSGLAELHMIFISVSAFILPFVVSHAWFTFSRIPTPEYKIWFTPDTMYKWGSRLRLLMPITFKMSIRYFDIREEAFTIKVPAKIKLGSLFHQFIMEQQRNTESFIELTDEQHRPYGWEFYNSQYAGLTKNMLDPEKTLEESRVRKNSIIIVRRVKMDPESAHSNNQTINES